MDHETHPRIPYEHRKSLSLDGAEVCGKLKALCSEVQFLTKVASPGDVVVYVAGSQGSHLPTLSKMFPMLRFDVFDMLTPLNPLVLAECASRFTFVSRKFEDRDARGYNCMGQRVLFMSDMRPLDDRPCGTHNTTYLTSFHDEDHDMKIQRKWVETMQPRQALLRFRIPYNETDGEIGKREAPDTPGKNCCIALSV